LVIGREVVVDTIVDVIADQRVVIATPEVTNRCGRFLECRHSFPYAPLKKGDEYNDDKILKRVVCSDLSRLTAAWISQRNASLSGTASGVWV
jgi:hypothetical protein